MPALTKALLLAALLALSGCILPALQGTAAVMTILVDAPKVGPAAQELFDKIRPEPHP